MPTVGVFNKEGNKVADMELNEKVFATEVNEYALHQVVVALLANKRQGTQSTKTRSEVRGGGIKPWRQKGTGRARQGSIRAPQWIKGGIVFAPKPRDYRVSVPKSMRKVAMKSALTSKVQDNQMIVLESLNFEAPKTKNVIEMLKALEAIQKVQWGLQSGLSADLMALDIKEALFEFGTITGQVTNDELLGNIFANFCIGK